MDYLIKTIELIGPWLKNCSGYYSQNKWNEDEYDEACWSLLIHLLSYADQNNCLLDMVIWLQDLSNEKFLNKKEFKPCGNMVLIKAHQLVDVEGEFENGDAVEEMSADEYDNHLLHGYRNLIIEMSGYVPFQLG